MNLFLKRVWETFVPISMQVRYTIAVKTKSCSTSRNLMIVRLGLVIQIHSQVASSLVALPLQFSLIYNLDISGTYSGDVILRFVICATYMHTLWVIEFALVKFNFKNHGRTYSEEHVANSPARLYIKIKKRAGWNFYFIRWKLRAECYARLLGTLEYLLHQTEVST